MTFFLSCFINLYCSQYSVINQVIIQPFFNIYDHFTISLSLWYSWEVVEAFGPHTCKTAEKNLLSKGCPVQVKWRVPCPIQKQVGMNYTSDILISEQSMQIYNGYLSVHLSCWTDAELSHMQNFFAYARHRSRLQHRINWPVHIAENLSFIELSWWIPSQGIFLAPVAFAFESIALLRRWLEGNLDHIDTRVYFNYNLQANYIILWWHGS